VPRAHTFDGWIVWYDFNGNIPATSSIKLSTDWVVPLAPTKVVNQDIAFFNSIETSSGGVDILQPVLDFGEIRNRWSMISEHCCLSGNDVQTTPVPVNAGDVVRGTVEGTSCNVSGVCASWVITTIDVTTGQSTVLNTTAPDGVPIEINPGVLETYDITSCDMLPANGEVTFYEHSVIDASGREVPIRYSFRKFDTAPAEFPMNCGYRGSAVGNRYTLIFGNLPTEIAWYLHRLQTGWYAVGITLVLFHFVVPFLLLLSRTMKREPRTIVVVASGVLIARLVDLFWLIAPEFHQTGISVSWLDVLLPVSMGAIWFGGFIRQLRGRAILPLHDPDFDEALGRIIEKGKERPAAAH